MALLMTIIYGDSHLIKVKEQLLQYGSKPNNIRWFGAGSQAYRNSCMTLCNRQFSTNNKKNHKIDNNFVSPGPSDHRG